MPPRRATVRQCVILAGGLAATPVGDRPFLAWLMREFCRFGVDRFLLLGGDLGDSLAGIAASLPRAVEITVGTGPLQVARDRLDQRFLICRGDTLFDCNLARLLADAATDPADALGRMLLRRAPGGTDYAGVALLDRRGLDRIGPDGSPESAALRGTLAEGFFLDIGIPADLKRARRELPGRLHRPALLLDRDGVLNVDLGFVSTRERFEWVEGAIAAVRRAVDLGWHVFVVTNQSGVARGRYDEAAVEGLMRWVADQLRRAGATLDDWRCCPFHPQAPLAAYRRDSDWRKPAPGMLLDLHRAWQFDLARSVMIGDNPSDMAAAERAGVRGMLFEGGNLARFTERVVTQAVSAAARG